MKTKMLLLLALCSVLHSWSAGARVTMPSFFSDGMVLQQECMVKIWGYSDNSEKLTVTTSWDARTYKCKPAANGSFAIEVHTPQAGGPYNITINDGDELVLSDILIGEVWICVGQSNMEMPVKGFSCQPTENVLDHLLDCRNDRLRCFMVTRAAADKECNNLVGEWKSSTINTVPDFSATAYFFAKRLQAVLDVPVGVIVCPWGGTSILGWIPLACVERTISASEIQSIIDLADKKKNYPGVLYNGMVAPVVGYAAKGFIWYQGCANVDHPQLYAKLMKAMIDEYRSRWGKRGRNMSFYAVELAPYRYGKNNEQGYERPLWVECVSKMMKGVPATALIPTSDAGHQTNIHPAKKDIVGDRLAATALKNDYGFTSLEPEPPAIASVDYRGGMAYITTTSALGPQLAVLSGFELAGKDGIYYQAKAYVNHRTSQIEVKAAQVPEPVAVRYNFHNYVNGATWRNWMGIPALPCRTDNWELK